MLPFAEMNWGHLLSGKIFPHITIRIMNCLSDCNTILEARKVWPDAFEDGALDKAAEALKQRSNLGKEFFDETTDTKRAMSIPIDRDETVDMVCNGCQIILNLT